MIVGNNYEDSCVPRDAVTDEVVLALTGGGFVDFNSLFFEVYGQIRAKNSASGSEEMLRLRMYEKLQNLISAGLVIKEARKYAPTDQLNIFASEIRKKPAIN